MLLLPTFPLAAACFPSMLCNTLAQPESESHATSFAHASSCVCRHRRCTSMRAHTHAQACMHARTHKHACTHACIHAGMHASRHALSLSLCDAQMHTSTLSSPENEIRRYPLWWSERRMPARQTAHPMSAAGSQPHVAARDLAGDGATVITPESGGKDVERVFLGLLHARRDPNEVGPTSSKSSRRKRFTSFHIQYRVQWTT